MCFREITLGGSTVRGDTDPRNLQDLASVIGVIGGGEFLCKGNAYKIMDDVLYKTWLGEWVQCLHAEAVYVYVNRGAIID